ncbi:hypothetical protein BGZ52_009359, partial [Haplosporangium bisporale]
NSKRYSHKKRRGIITINNTSNYQVKLNPHLRPRAHCICSQSKNHIGQRRLLNRNHNNPKRSN